MNYWLMSIKWGSKGRYFNEEIKKDGIIAIGHYELNEQSLASIKNQADINKVVDDPYGRKYYKMFLLEMKIGDVVYVRGNNKDRKLGANIFGRCRITSDYIYDKKRFAKITGLSIDKSFYHLREAEWDKQFKPVRNGKDDLRSGMNTIVKLDSKKVKEFEKKYNLKPFGQNPETEEKIEDIDKNYPYPEGEEIYGVYSRHERNQRLKEKVVKIHGLKCKVCGFDFEETYGEYGKGYIEVHHKIPLHSAGVGSPNPELDMTVLCSNCHRMIHHLKNDTLSVKELKKIVNKQRSDH